MGTDSTINPKTQIIVALIAAIAVIIGAYFSYQAAKEPVLIVIGATQTAEAKSTSIAQTLIAQSDNQTQAASVPSSTPHLITITLTNNDCNAQNFYLDDNLVFSPIEAGSTLTYSTLPGKHSSHTCVPNTTTCAEKTWYDWTASTTQSIGRSSKCRITITLTNNDCNAQNFYLDDNLVFSPIEAGSTLTYSTLPGKHSSHTCVPNTTICAEKSWYEWTTSTTQSIGRSSKCP